MEDKQWLLPFAEPADLQPLLSESMLDVSDLVRLLPNAGQRLDCNKCSLELCHPRSLK